MIDGKSHAALSSIWAQNCSWISHVYNIASISNYQQNNSARSRFFRTSLLLSCTINKHTFCLFKPFSYCFFRIMRKSRLFNDKLMQIVPEKISTSCSSVSIKHSKKWTFRPFFSLPWMGLQNIKNYADSVFIVVPNNPFIRICSICPYNSVFLIWTFRLVNSCVKNLVSRH